MRSETGRWAVIVGNAPQTCSRFTETFPPPLHFFVFLVYFTFVFVISYFLGLGLGWGYNITYTHCMMHVLALKVRTYCVLYVLALTNIAEHCVASYPSYLCWIKKGVNLVIVSTWHLVLWTSSLYRQQYIVVSLPFDKCTYCKCL